MMEQRRYDAMVRSWIRYRQPANRDTIIATLESGVNTLWRRAQLSIKDQPLRNVVNEILRDASTRFPALAPVKLDGGSGILVNGLHENPSREDTQELREGTRYVMVRFLVVTCKLTSDDIVRALDPPAGPTAAD